MSKILGNIDIKEEVSYKGVKRRSKIATFFIDSIPASGSEAKMEHAPGNIGVYDIIVPFDCTLDDICFSIDETSTNWTINYEIYVDDVKERNGTAGDATYQSVIISPSTPLPLTELEELYIKVSENSSCLGQGLICSMYAYQD